MGSGGPSESGTLTDLENTTSSLELQLRQLKDAFDKNQVKLASTPSGWPVLGYITDGFGSRANPFGGGGSEYHGGLDISAPFGTGINSTADGIVIFAGMAGGFVTAALAIFASEAGVLPIPSPIAGALGFPVATILALVISSFVRETSRHDLEVVRDIRVPGGEIIYDREMRRLQLKKHART